MKVSRRFSLFCALICVAANCTVHAQTDTTSLREVFQQLSLRDLMNVTIVTVSKKEESVFDAPLASSVITGEELQRAGVTSALEGLRLVPGFIVREQTPGNYDMHIRGLDATDPFANMVSTQNTISLVMVNNRIVYNEAFGSIFWDMLQLSIDDIDRIEVVRGPAAALYGPNAASGVINIITKKPSQKEGFYATSYSQGGMFNTALLNGAIGYGKREGLSVRVGGNFDNRARHHVDYYRFALANPFNSGINLVEGGFRTRPDSLQRVQTVTIPGIGTIPNPNAPPVSIPLPFGQERYPDLSLATNRWLLNAHLLYNDESVSINILGGVARSQIQRPSLSTSSFPIITEKNRNDFGQIFGTWKNLSFNADFNTGENDILGIIPYNYTIINANADYSIDLRENFNIKTGFAVRYAFFSSQSNDPRAIPSSFNFSGAPFLRMEYAISKFRIIAGLRVDIFRVPSIAFFSPQAIVTYKPSQDILLRLSYGRSSRSPFVTSVFGDIEPITTLPAQIRANPNIQLLTIDALETGARINLADLISLDIEGFLISARNFEALTFKELIPVSQLENPSLGLPLFVPRFAFENTSQQALQYGSSLTVNVVPTPQFKVQLFATWQQTRVTNYNYKNPTASSPQNPLGQGQNVVDSAFINASTPTLFGGGVLNYTPVAALNINLNAYFYSQQMLTLTSAEVSDNQSVNRFTIAPNLLLNATVSYRVLTSVSVFASARNLLGAGRRQFGFADQINMVILGGVILSL